MKAKQWPLPSPVLQRMPQYLWFVKEQASRGEEFVSSQEIAYALGLTPSCVRQDFSHLQVTGYGKKGYDVVRLVQALAACLSTDLEKRVAIIGAGNLGQALALHGGLAQYGFCVRAILDVAPTVIGTTVGSLTVRSMRELQEVVRDERIDTGIIATPAEAAQEVADHLIFCGVRGLLNLALTRVVVRRDVPVVNSRIVADLLMLSSLQGLAQRQPKAGERPSPD